MYVHDLSLSISPLLSLPAGLPFANLPSVKEEMFPPSHPAQTHRHTHRLSCRLSLSLSGSISPSSSQPLAKPTTQHCSALRGVLSLSLSLISAHFSLL